MTENRLLKVENRCILVKNMKKIDIHSHILWGLDDGAATKEQSLEMLKIAANDGITQIIATPHYHYGKGKAAPEKILRKVEELRKTTAEEQIQIQLYAGNELYYTHDLLEELKAGACLTIAGTDYVLLEFSVDTDRKRMQNAIYQFSSAGYYPIIAHPERYETLIAFPELMQELGNLGAYFQMNAGSLSKSHGWRRKQFIRSMLKNGMIQFLATDAHDTQKRPPQFGKNADRLIKKCGKSEAAEMLYENAKMLINNEII